MLSTELIIQKNYIKISVISTQYTKTVDGVKGALRISFAIYLRVLRSLALQE